MIRVENWWDFSELEEIADAIGVPIYTAKSRCEHGKLAEDTCRFCENGYVDDAHTFCYTRSEPAGWLDKAYTQEGLKTPLGYSYYMMATTDDGLAVGYISARFQKKFDKYFEEQNEQA